MPFEPLFVTLDESEPLPRFAVLHLPTSDQVPVGLVVHAPAFAEEMNKSRRMVALQARALADDGWAVLLLDPLGCGDSPGDFADADWDRWVRDITQAMAWLRKVFAQRWPGAQEPPRTFWGLRAGALLASAAAARTPGSSSLLLWQPSLQGRLVLQQFLRLLSAGELMAGGSGALQAAKARLAAGDCVEVAGYRLSSGMAAGLEAASLGLPAPPGRVVSIEVSSREGATLSPALAAATTSWQAHGWQVDTDITAGPAFWQSTEVEDAPALIATTRAALRPSGRPARGLADQATA